MSAKAGEMHPVDEAFHKLAVKERDYERVRSDRFEAERDRLRSGIQAEIERLRKDALNLTAAEGFDAINVAADRLQALLADDDTKGAE